jgi:biopolymer transport protein ExbB
MPSTVQLLPPSLTPWDMFLSADQVVQAVMVMLLMASVVTWTMLLVKGAELLASRRRMAGSLAAVSKAPDLRTARANVTSVGMVGLFAAAQSEMEASAALPAAGVKERVAVRLRRIELAMGRRMARGTGVLASIGACGPFVGLFGTVWGIMNSFVGISRAQTTSLAVVAPGIAEALLATACGLAAAIPAVLVYNLFARAIGGYRASLGDLSASVQVLVSRELDQRITELNIAPLVRRSPPLRRAAD